MTTTATIKEIATTTLFYKADWKFNGSLITAIHGKDKSTQERYGASPDGFVMISTKAKNHQMVDPSAIVTA